MGSDNEELVDSHSIPRSFMAAMLCIAYQENEPFSRPASFIITRKTLFRLEIYKIKAHWSVNGAIGRGTFIGK